MSLQNIIPFFGARPNLRNFGLSFKFNAIAAVTILCSVSFFNVSCNSSSDVNRKAQSDLFKDYDGRFLELLGNANKQIGKDVLTYEPIAPALLPKKVTIRANHYELGYTIGLIAKGYFGDAMKKEMIRKPEAELINRQIVEMYRSIYPAYLELVRGTATAYDLPMDSVDLRYMEHWFFTLLWWRLFEYDEFEKVTDYYRSGKSIFDFSRCSIVSYCEKEDSNHLIGRNFDVTSDRPHFVVTTELEGAYRTVGNTCYMLYHWIEEGFNEKGLYIGVATNGHPSKYNQKESQYPEKPAVQIIHMARIVLDTCGTVDEALELIASVRIWFPVEVNHLLIADSTGKAVVVEFDTDRNMAAFHTDKPYLILTNTAYQEGIDYVKDNCSRYRRAEKMLSTRLKSRDDMFSIMQAIQLKSGNSRTLWTSISDLSSQEIDVRLRSEQFRVPHVFQIGQ